MTRNIPELEYRKMLQEIRMLAFRHDSNYLRNIDIYTGTSNTNPQKIAKSAAQEYKKDLIDIAKHTLDLLPSIHQYPLRSLQKITDFVSREKATSKQQGIKAFICQPHKTKLSIPVSSYCLNSSENQLLLWLITTLITQLESAKSLYNHGGIFFESLSNSNDNTEQNLNNTGIDIFIKKLKTAIQHPFFAKVTLVNVPPTPTERMLGSIGYGEIYRLFQQKILCHSSVSVFNKAQAKFMQIERLPVHKDSKVYEVWCFLQLYFAFIELANFSASNTKILDAIHIKEQIISFTEGCCLTLYRKTDNLTLKLYYERSITHEGEKKRPDYFIELHHKELKKPLAFILDAKWRNYAQMPHNTEKCNKSTQDKDEGYNCIGCDVFHVALEKYYNRFKIHQDFLLLSSFIIHSDTEKTKNKSDNSDTKINRHEHWNSFNFLEWLSNFDGYKEIKKNPKILGHTIGAIIFRPDDTLNKTLSRLIFTLLTFHLGDFLQRDELCSRCGTKNIVSKNQKYNCVTCGLDWQILSCPDKHRVINMGKSHHSLHVLEASGNSMKCPTCEKRICVNQA